MRWIASAFRRKFKAILSNRRRPVCSRFPTPMVQVGVRGGIAFSDSAPGGFRFLSPRRKEQRDSNKLFGNVRISILRDSVTRRLPQSLRDSYPQPQSARLPLTGCRLFRLTRSSRFRLRRTAHWADTRIAPLPEGASAHAKAAGLYRLRGTPTVIRRGGCHLPQGGSLCALMRLVYPAPLS